MVHIAAGVRCETLDGVVKRKQPETAPVRSPRRPPAGEPDPSAASRRVAPRTDVDVPLARAVLDLAWQRQQWRQADLMRELDWTKDRVSRRMRDDGPTVAWSVADLVDVAGVLGVQPSALLTAAGLDRAQADLLDAVETDQSIDGRSKAAIAHLIRLARRTG